MKRAPVILFIVAGVAVVVGFIQLGAHQRQAAKMVQSIVETDTAGGAATDLEKELAAYTRSHMKTPASYELEGSYKRALTSAQAATSPTGNGQVYAAAQAACASRADSIAQAHCVQNYLQAHAAPAANPAVVALPNEGDYTKTLSSPGWTSDSAGLSFLVAIVAAVLGVYVLVVSIAKKASY